VHRIPFRKPPKHLDSEKRTHLTQCLPDFISKQLKKARDKSGYYKDLPVDARPGFHEIRSLGSKLYKDVGIDPQTLLGHTSAKMTKHYLDGHGVQWTEVSAGLAFSKVS
jgi:integrase